MTDSKTAHEITVVREFCRAAALPVDEVTIEARLPPEPDIFCMVNNEPRFFELGRLLDAEIPKLMIEVWRNPGVPVRPRIERIGLPERDMLKQKLAKRYETNNLPCDLILYFDAESLLTAGGIPPIPFPEHARYVMQPILEASMGCFQRVWVYERYRGSVLWRYPLEKSDAA